MKYRIRQIREAQGMTQDDLLARTDLNRKATLSDLENGKTNPVLSTLQSIAKALNVRLTDLFDDEGDDPDARILYERIMALPPDQREAFLKVIPPAPQKQDG